MPPYVENHPFLKSKWVEFHEKFIKHSFPVEDSFLLPNPEPDQDEDLLEHTINEQ